MHGCEIIERLLLTILTGLLSIFKTKTWSEIPIYHQECDEKKTRAATGVRANASVSAAIPDLDRSRLRREVDGHALDAGDLAQRPLHRLPAVLHALHPRDVQADVR